MTKPLPIIAAVVLSLCALARADQFMVDPIHSTVLAKVKHFGTTNFYARFNHIDGTLSTAPNGDLEAMNLSVDVGSVDTNNKQRDEHLRSAEFFDAKQFPQITFKSTSVKKTDKGFEVTGDLTLHGVTKQITALVKKTGDGTNVQKKSIVGYETGFTVLRSDYGMTNYVGMVGDEVTLMVSLEAAKTE